MILLVFAKAASAADISPATLCDHAIAAAETQLHLPKGILAAVGRAESGRPDHVGRIHPWPYTINAEGTGRFLPSKAAATAAVLSLKRRGVQSIDVGCVQVNLLHHPSAFASLEQAFDPVANTFYGAWFLSELYGELKSWPAAIAAYHSRTPDIGASYATRVMAIWTGAPLRSALLKRAKRPSSPYGSWPPAGVSYGALPPMDFAYRAFASPSRGDR